MDFTTTTEITKKGSRIFKEYNQAIVLKNNKDIGLLLGGKLAKAVIDSGILFQFEKQLLASTEKKQQNVEIEPLKGSEEFIGTAEHKELISLMKSA